jgi:hypothetical protein
MSNFLLWLRGAWRSRTVWAGLALIVAGAGQVGPLQRVVPPATVGWLLMTIGAGVIALRSITRTSLSAKVPGTSTPAK